MDLQHSSKSTEETKLLESQLSVLREKYYFLESELKAITKEKEKYKAIAEFAHDWEFWIDPKFNFLWISPSSHDLTGYTPDEFFKNPNLFYELIYQEDDQQVRRFMHDSLSFMQIGQNIEYRILTKTKQLRWCEMNGKAVFDERNHYLGQRISIRDITRLKTALGLVREMAESQEWERKVKERYRDEISGKERELVTSLIRIAQKNELVAYIRKNLGLIHMTVPPPMQLKIATILDKVDEHQRMQLFNWEDFKCHFEKVHQGFFIRLNERFPKLTVKDQRMCAYLYLGLSTKELAALTNITPASAEIARIRLRKKLGLSRLQNMNSFLLAL